MKEITIALLIFIVIVFGFYQLSVASLTENCRNFATESNRETKMSYLGYGNWNCLTPTKDGKWIDATLLRGQE